MSSKDRRGDIIISIAVMLQPLLVVIQQAMILLFNMNTDTATFYRVIFTAVPMIPAIIVGISRKSVLFFFSYLITISLLGLTIAFFPDNTTFVISEGTRFLLPIVLPSLLCLICVSDIGIVESVVYTISWIEAVLLLILFSTIFFGNNIFVGYNMPLSFAALFPMIFLFESRRFWSIVVSIILFVGVLMIGARGPAFCFIVFVILNMLHNRGRFTLPLIVLLVLFAFYVPQVVDWISSFGIQSRTIDMYQNGMIDSDSGRREIRLFFINKLLENPIFGLGLYGDRLYGYGYCHNVLLELYLNFGIIVGSIIVISMIFYAIKTYRMSSNSDKDVLIAYFCAFLLPLMTSSSYLIENNLAMFLGLFYLEHEKKGKE